MILLRRYLDFEEKDLDIERICNATHVPCNHFWVCLRRMFNERHGGRNAQRLSGADDDETSFERLF